MTVAALSSAAEDHILHLPSPQGPGGLLPHDPADGVRQVGLARAVGAQQAKDLAGGDAQVKVVERDKIVVALDEVFDVDDVCHEAALLLLAARYDCIIAGADGAHQ